LASKLLLQTAETVGNSTLLPLKKKIIMKKITKKEPASKAPAKKTVTAAPAPKVVAASKPATRKKKATATEPPATFITARIDIGFGNHLYVRGTGPGLSWDRGVAMDCVGTGLWTTTVKFAKAPVTFKFLVNDLSWSSGEDFVVEPGQSLTISPGF
jgi:hypothetical protein